MVKKLAIERVQFPEYTNFLMVILSYDYLMDKVNAPNSWIDTWLKHYYENMFIENSLLRCKKSLCWYIHYSKARLHFVHSSMLHSRTLKNNTCIETIFTEKGGHVGFPLKHTQEHWLTCNQIITLATIIKHDSYPLSVLFLFKEQVMKNHGYPL